jgi:hypothetical protein
MNMRGTPKGRRVDAVVRPRVCAEQTHRLYRRRHLNSISTSSSSP